MEFNPDPEARDSMISGGFWLVGQCKKNPNSTHRDRAVSCTTEVATLTDEGIHEGKKVNAEELQHFDNAKIKAVLEQLPFRIRSLFLSFLIKYNYVALNSQQVWPICNSISERLKISIQLPNYLDKICFSTALRLFEFSTDKLSFLGFGLKNSEEHDTSGWHRNHPTYNMCPEMVELLLSVGVPYDEKFLYNAVQEIVAAAPLQFSKLALLSSLGGKESILPELGFMNLEPSVQAVLQQFIKELQKKEIVAARDQWDRIKLVENEVPYEIIARLTDELSATIERWWLDSLFPIAKPSESRKQIRDIKDEESGQLITVSSDEDGKSPPRSKEIGSGELQVFLGTAGNGEKIYWIPSKEPNWNFVVVGSAGSGKTQTVRSILFEFQKSATPYIVFDFRNDYTPNKSQSSKLGKVLDLRTIAINPLELDFSNDPKKQKHEVSDIINLVYNIGAIQTNYVRDAIKMAYKERGIDEEDKSTWNKTPPSFTDVKNTLSLLSEEGTSERKNSIQGIFARLDPIFDYEVFSDTKTMIPFEKLTQGQTIIDLSGLPNDNLKSVVCEFLLRKLRFFLYGLEGSRSSRLYLVIDEAHRLKYDKESSTGQLLKEARKYGVGMILATQDPVDFTDVVYNNVGGVLSLQITDPKYAKSIAEHLGGISWLDVKNGLSEKFSAYLKFSSDKEPKKLMITPYYERAG